MIKSLTIILTVLLLTLNAAAQAEKINWETDFKKAQAMALESGKPLLLDFTADWCKPCRTMDKEFWVREDVVQAVKSFVAVKIDYVTEKFLVSRYGAQGIPFVAFTDPLGNTITSRQGFSTRNSNDLIQIFKEMPTDFSPLKKNYQALELKKDDGLALLEIADFYRISRMLVLSNDFYKRALKTEEIKSDVGKKESITVTLGLNPFSYKDYKAANGFMEDYLKNYPAGKYKEVAFTVLSIGNANLGKKKEAEKYLEMMKTDFPESTNLSAATKAVEEAKNNKNNKQIPNSKYQTPDYIIQIGVNRINIICF